MSASFFDNVIRRYLKLQESEQDKASDECQIYFDSLLFFLELLNHFLTSNLAACSVLVYTVVYQRPLFDQCANTEAFRALVANIMEVNTVPSLSLT
jgi:hypothetical protein